MRRSVKICVDTAMYIIFLYLMSYRPGRGLYLHGVFGCSLFALFLIHHILNLRWFRGLAKGKYNFRRRLFVGVDFLLLVAMLVMAVSSAMMSGDVFSFSPFMSTQLGRDLHICSTAWGFLLMIFHMGLHTHSLFARLHRKMKETIFAYVYNLLFGIALIIGIWCFIQSGLWRSLFLVSIWLPTFELYQFYVLYLMITFAACQLVHLFLNVAGHYNRSMKGGH